MSLLVSSEPDIVIYAMDEAGIKREATITSGWFPKGKKAIVLSPSTHEKVNLVGAVNLSTGQIILNKVERFNKDACIEFLDKIERNESKECKKIYVILDNARPHRAKAVYKYLCNNSKNRIHLIFLPPYSPELNPSENIWLQLRREKTHNTFFPTLSALIDSIDDFEKTYSVPNTLMKSLCAFY